MFDQLDGFISTKTVVGEPMTIDNVIIIPLVDVSFGLGGGSMGGESAEPKKQDEKSMGGMGAKISPSAMLVIIDGAVQLVNLKNQDSVNKLIDLIPGIATKFDSILERFTKKKEDEAETSAETPPELEEVDE